MCVCVCACVCVHVCVHTPITLQSLCSSLYVCFCFSLRVCVSLSITHTHTHALSHFPSHAHTKKTNADLVSALLCTHTSVSAPPSISPYYTPTLSLSLTLSLNTYIHISLYSLSLTSLSHSHTHTHTLFLFSNLYIHHIYISSVLYAKFAHPCTATQSPMLHNPDFVLPTCYYMQPPALKTSHLSKFLLETLFYIFYNMPRDTLQVYAAKELYVV